MNTNATYSQISRRGLVHEALLYRSEEELLQAVTAFVRDAAARGEPVLVALPGGHLEQLQAGLEADQSVELVDMALVGRNPTCMLPIIEEWVEGHGDGTGRVRLVCETVWPGRGHAETIECLRQTALINLVLADAPVTILCPYDAEHLDPVTLDGAELTHPTIVEAGRRRPSNSYRPPSSRDMGDLWPLDSPHEPVYEHYFDGDLSEFRHAVADDPLVSGLSDERRADLVLAVNEAATNAVRHGDQTCTARIWEDIDGVVTEVRTGRPIADLMMGCRRPPVEASSGRGLWLINAVCDLVQARAFEDHTTLRMHIHDNGPL